MATNNNNGAKNPRNMLGFKFFKEKDDGDFKLIRIVKTFNDGKVKIVDDEGNFSKLPVDEIAKEGYTPLESIGVVSFSIVKIANNYDVIITLTRKLDIKVGLTVPCVICRQSVTDFFYNIIARQEDHGYVGVSVSEKTCPTNIQYGQLLACDDIVFGEMVNIYYDDTIDSVLNCVSILRYNEILEELFQRHVAHENNPKLKLKTCDKGWCRNIRDLLFFNNFWIDVDQAYNITDVDFEIANYIIEKKDGNDKEYNSFSKDVITFLSSTFQINIVDCIVIEYYYDIDFGEYHNQNYILLRDSTEKLYLTVYIVNGEYLEQDLAIAEEKKHLADSLRLKIASKYNE